MTDDDRICLDDLDFGCPVPQDVKALIEAVL